MKSFRINRLFNPDSHRCFIASLDQGMNADHGALQGQENIERTVQLVALSAPDALQLGVGQATLLQSLPGKTKPSLVLRLDVTNLTGANRDSSFYSTLLDEAVEQAVLFDAACVVTRLISMPGHSELTKECIQNIFKLKPKCERFGMPLMIDALPFKPFEKGSPLQFDGHIEQVLPLVRQAAELGADIIQTNCTSDLSSFRKVIEAARVPLLVRGGARVADRELLEHTEQIIAQGATGIVYSRNVIQHPDPAGVTRALLAIVHERTKALDAARFIRG